MWIPDGIETSQYFLTSLHSQTIWEQNHSLLVQLVLNCRWLSTTVSHFGICMVFFLYLHGNFITFCSFLELWMTESWRNIDWFYSPVYWKSMRTLFLFFGSFGKMQNNLSSPHGCGNTDLDLKLVTFHWDSQAPKVSDKLLKNIWNLEW